MSSVIQTTEPNTVISTDADNTTTVEVYHVEVTPPPPPIGVSWKPAYAAFHDTTTHTNQTPQVQAFTYNNVTESDGITLNGSQIFVDRDGVYNFQFSVVVTKADGGTDNVDMWFAKNGQDIPDSNTRATLNGNGQVQVLAWNFLTSLDAGDHIELKWYSADTALSFPTTGPFTNPTRPRVPSIIATITQIAPLGE